MLCLMFDDCTLMKQSMDSLTFWKATEPNQFPPTGDSIKGFTTLATLVTLRKTVAGLFAND